MRPPPPESLLPPPEYPPLEVPEDDEPEDELELGDELELESDPELPTLRAPRAEPGVRLVGVALSPVPVVLLEPAGLTRV